MATRSQLRTRLVLALLLMLTIIVFTAFFIVFRSLKSSMSTDQESFLTTAVNLARMYCDIRYAGDWTARDGSLYKGPTLMSGNTEVTSGVARYLAPDIEIELGAGTPPVSLSQRRLPWYERLLFLQRPPDQPGGMTEPPPSEAPTVTSSGAFIGLREQGGAEVGWIYAGKRTDGSEAGERESALLMFLLVVGSAIAVLIIIGLSLIVFRLSKPIDTIVEAHNRAVKRNVELSRTSRTDQLTGLLNRRGFLEVVAKEVAATAVTGDIYVAMLDVDHFKGINDTHGHECGDAVLVALAQRLQNGVRKGDYCARWGGEEFLALLIGVDRALAERSAQRLRVAVEQNAFSYGEKVLPVTVTIGLARLDDIGRLTEAIDRADKALYQGKQAGRNRVVVHDGPA